MQAASVVFRGVVEVGWGLDELVKCGSIAILLCSTLRVTVALAYREGFSCRPRDDTLAGVAVDALNVG